jgi:hypothetical protein
MGGTINMAETLKMNVIKNRKCRFIWSAMVLPLLPPGKRKQVALNYSGVLLNRGRLSVVR